MTTPSTRQRLSDEMRTRGFDDVADELDRMEAVVRAAESAIRYTLATLPTPGSPDIVATRDKDWVAIHRGRAMSACRQLTGLLHDLASAGSEEG